VPSSFVSGADQCSVADPVGVSLTVIVNGPRTSSSSPSETVMVTPENAPTSVASGVP
jgi:hypothetical protein